MKSIDAHEPKTLFPSQPADQLTDKSAHKPDEERNNRLLDGLSESQHQAVTHTSNSVIVVAGAGSGKTRVLTRRIAWRCSTGDLDPTRTVAVTFTRKAANELNLRLNKLLGQQRVNAGTFHSLALGKLQQRWQDQNRPPKSITQSKSRLVSQILRSSGQNSGRKKSPNVTELCAEISWANSQLMSPEDYSARAEVRGRKSPLSVEDTAEIMQHYIELKKKKQVMDFDDVLGNLCLEIQQDQAYRSSIEWQFKHIFVDEFQDITPLQHQLLSLWTAEEKDIFIVGDPNQAIYGWNGSDPTIIDTVAKDNQDIPVVYLQENYRSKPEILSLAKNLVNTKTSSFLSPNYPEPTRSSGATISFNQYGDENSEAKAIAEKLRLRHSQADSWSKQAVLARTNNQLEVIKQHLIAARIPCEIRNDAKNDALSTQDSKNNHRQYAGQDEAENGNHPIDLTGPEHGQTDNVALLSFHAAKGLEWPIVYVAGLETGYVPIFHAENGFQLAEEERLLYVALTRACDELHVSWSIQRSFGARVVRREPSPYVELLQNSYLGKAASSRSRSHWRKNIGKARTELESKRGSRKTNDSSKALRKELFKWRSRKAYASRVASSAIMSDHAIEQIVQQKPSNLDDLQSATQISEQRLSRHADQLIEIVNQAENQD